MKNSAGDLEYATAWDGGLVFVVVVVVHVLLIKLSPRLLVYYHVQYVQRLYNTDVLDSVSTGYEVKIF